MDHGLMYYSYPESVSTVNIGDYIQSLAAAQYLPDNCQPVLIDRENLSSYSGGAVKMIMNGWYMHNPVHWPPASQINPLFVAFHLNQNVKEQMMSLDGVSYLKQHAPIGCRDEDTRQTLNEYGVDAYYSSCLTLTLGKKYAVQGNRSSEVLFVDPCLDSCSYLFRKLESKGWIKNKKKQIIDSIELESKMKPNLFYKTYEKIFPMSILKDSTYIRHEIPKTHFKDEESKFRYAENLITRYAKARLVVTSRIHCALPCLALGTPVIYVHDTYTRMVDKARVEKLLELFHVVTISKNTLESNDICLQTLKNDFDSFELINKTDCKEYAEKLKEACSRFID